MKQLPAKNLCILFLTALIWGTAFVAQSVGMDHIGPFAFNAARSFVGGVALIPVILFFDLGKDVLSVEERARLEAFAKSEALNDAEIIITGSADSATGSAETNKAISQRRATHVYELLLNRFGVEKSRVKIEAIGDTANVGSPEENRCVTVTASRVLK